MRKLIFVLAALVIWAMIVNFIFSIIAYGHEVDLTLLRDIICSYETRGKAKPDEALGRDQELGRCQILPTTAKQVGYREWWRLKEKAYSKKVALAILRNCHRRYKTAFSLAYCYTAGKRAKVRKGRKYEYATVVTQKYSDLTREIRIVKR